MSVLWEEEKQAIGDHVIMQGFSENYIRFESTYDASKVNTLEQLRFDKFSESGLALSSLKTHLQ